MIAEDLYAAYRSSLMRVCVILPPWDKMGEDEKEAWHAVESVAVQRWVSNAGAVEIA